MPLFTAALLLSFGSSPALVASTEDVATADAFARDRTTLSIAGAGSWTAAPIFGGVHEAGRGAMLLSLQLGRSLNTGRLLSLDYIARAVPMELAIGSLVPTAGTLPGSRLRQATVYGAGLDLVGIGLRARRGGWRPYASVTGGFRLFTEPVPTPL